MQIVQNPLASIRGQKDPVDKIRTGEMEFILRNGSGLVIQEIISLIAQRGNNGVDHTLKNQHDFEVVEFIQNIFGFHPSPAGLHF